MVKLQATLRALVPQTESLGASVSGILRRDGLPNRFATLVYLVLSEGAGDLRMPNAGHMPPVVMRGGGLERLPPTSMALGMMPDVTFTEQRVHLAEGDVFVAYSDGVTEAMNAAEDFFGDERLDAVILGALGEPTAVLGERILEAVETFAGVAKPHDDVSVLVLRRTADGPPDSPGGGSSFR